MSVPPICLECGAYIRTGSLQQVGICIRCYIDRPVVGEMYRRHGPKGVETGVDLDEIRECVDTYWSERDVNSVADAVTNFTSFLDTAETPLLLGKLLMHMALSRQVFLNEGRDGGVGPNFALFICGIAACQPPSGTDSSYYEMLDLATSVMNMVETSCPDSRFSEKKNNIAFDLALREFSLGRLASPGQYIAAAERFYGPHSHQMDTQFGFRITDVIEVVDTITDRRAALDSKLYNKVPKMARGISVADRLATLRSRVPDLVAEYEFIFPFLDDWGHELADRLYWITADQLYSKVDLSFSRLDNVLNSLSVELGTAKGYRSPTNHNPLHENPLIKFDDSSV